MPVRKIPRKSKSLSGRFHSHKVGRLISFESALERDYFVLQEFSAEVALFEEQPVEIPVTKPNGVEGSYFPDALVWYLNADRPPTLAEIKYQSQLEKDREELAPKLESGRRYAAAHGYTFQAVTDREIRTPLLVNAKFLLPFRHHPSDPLVFEAAIGLVGTRDSITCEALLAALESATGWPRAELLPCLWHLISTFALSTNLNTRLDMSSRLSLPIQSGDPA